MDTLGLVDLIRVLSALESRGDGLPGRLDDRTQTAVSAARTALVSRLVTCHLAGEDLRTDTESLVGLNDLLIKLEQEGDGCSVGLSPEDLRFSSELREALIERIRLHPGGQAISLLLQRLVPQPVAPAQSASAQATGSSTEASLPAQRVQPTSPTAAATLKAETIQSSEPVPAPAKPVPQAVEAQPAASLAETAEHLLAPPPARQATTQEPAGLTSLERALHRAHDGIEGLAARLSDGARRRKEKEDDGTLIQRRFDEILKSVAPNGLAGLKPSTG